MLISSNVIFDLQLKPEVELRHTCQDISDLHQDKHATNSTVIVLSALLVANNLIQDCPSYDNVSQRIVEHGHKNEGVIRCNVTTSVPTPYESPSNLGCHMTKLFFEGNVH